MKYTVIKTKSGWAVQNVSSYVISYIGTELECLKVANTLNGVY